MRRLLLTFLLVAAFPSELLAAISANAVFQVETTAGASDLNGGAFTSGASGTDFTTASPSPHVTIDGATITATVHSTTTQLNVTGYNVVAGDVGNYVRIAGGTMTAGLYEITAADDPNDRWTLDRSGGTAAQTGTGRMGGALASPGRAAADMTVSGHKTWVKTGTYTITTTTPGTAGPVLCASGINVTIEGYSSTRGDQAATPTLDAGAQTGVNLFAGQGTATQEFVSLKADGQAGASNVGFAFASVRNAAFKSVAFDCVTGFTTTGARTVVEQCLADTCSTAGFVDCFAYDCEAKTCGVGFSIATASIHLSRCLARGCTTDGFVTSAAPVTFKNCTADDNGQYGFNLGSALTARCTNCLATNHDGGGDAGFFTAGTVLASLKNCAGYNNTTNASGTFLRNQGFITVTVDPYINQAGGDFRPNRRANGGLLLMNAGVSVYGQTDYKVIGALDFSPYILAR